MKSRRGFIKMMAGAMPAAAVVAAVSQKGLSAESQPKSADKQQFIDIENHNGPLGGMFQQSDPFYENAAHCVRKRPARNAFYHNPEVGDWFYHDAKDRCYVFDGHVWVWLLNPPDEGVSNGPFQSDDGKIEWIIEKGRVVLTRCPFERAKRVRELLTDIKWHGFADPSRKCWSCELTHANTVNLRYHV